MSGNVYYIKVVNDIEFYVVKTKDNEHMLNELELILIEQQKVIRDVNIFKYKFKNNRKSNEILKVLENKFNMNIQNFKEKANELCEYQTKRTIQNFIEEYEIDENDIIEDIVKDDVTINEYNKRTWFSNFLGYCNICPYEKLPTEKND